MGQFSVGLLGVITRIVTPLVEKTARKARKYIAQGDALGVNHQPFRHTYGMAVWLATPI